MIISCIKCNKKFDIDDGLIPEKGRLLECSSCNHRWFFKDVISNNVVKNELSNTTNILHSPSIEEKDDISIKGDLVDEEILINKEPEIQVFETNNDTFKFKSFNKNNIEKNKNKKKKINILNIIIVFIISFTALIILIDTFKLPISVIFPNIEFLLYNLYESIMDIKLFINDLI
jgi:predicted Zn finger-like uncharacterized protein